ncbi:MAG: hypothetical protein ABS35_24360 [Kaistia sp. SCN 65-12]|nr:MAG: hypothetical protein ABS35_24360 [Kaistia sp. SCN 65-12]
MAAQFLLDHYGAPAMLMALLLGIAFSFLSFSSAWGTTLSILLTVGIIVTTRFGLLVSKFLGQDWHLGLLTSGAVWALICGMAAVSMKTLLRPSHGGRRLCRGACSR